MKTIKFPAMAALVALLAMPAFAQTADGSESGMVAPPRLSVAEGDVQFWRPASDGWEPAQINAALAEGDSVNAGSDATVELQVGPRDYVRMMANTQLTLEAHDAGTMHFRLASGETSLDLRGGRSAQLVRIDTEDANIVVGGLGYYRISAREGETRLVVRNQGRATLTFADGRSRSVGAGEEIVVQGGGARIDSHGAPPLDAWDRWNDARSDYYASAASNRYVSDEVYGAADLDQHGRWREDSTYGWIWMPAVASGWAPYSSGNWQWHPAYGWTWVDVAPWGWTTSHYGRWVHMGGGWGWAPGPRRARVVYAPALVAFFQVSGGMSWVALGWGEPLVPWWGRPGFRGSAWWGGWGGPRVAYHHERHTYHNRNVATAVITVRENEFGRHRVRGSSLQLAPGVNMRSVRGEHPVRFAAEHEVRRDAMPARPRFEQRREEQRPPVVLQPRLTAPALEMRREVPMQRERLREIQRERPREIQRERPREIQRERRQEERVVIQREAPRMQPQRMEPARVEMLRPQVRTPSAPEVQRRAPERELGGLRDRGWSRGAVERD